MINTGSVKLASGEYWLTINTTATATAELDDISDIEYDFDLTDSQDLVDNIGVTPGVMTAKFNDEMNSLASLYDTLESEIGTPSASTGYATISATLTRRPYGSSSLQQFPFQVQFNGVDFNELEGQTTVRLLPPQQSNVNVAQYFANITGSIPLNTFSLELGGVPESTVYAPGDVLEDLTAYINPTATATIFDSSPIPGGGSGVPLVLYPDFAGVGNAGNVSFFITEFTGGSTGNGLIYDKYRSMAGLDSAIYGSAFGTNFYVGRQTDNHRVTLDFDDIVNIKLLKVNRDINNQTFNISNPDTALSQIVPDSDSQNYNRLSTRNVGIDYAGHSPLLTKAQVVTAGVLVEGQYTGYTSPDIEGIALESAQRGYSNALGSAAWKVEHQRIEVEILSIDKVRPWETFEFDATDSDIPDRYKNKVFRPSSIQYDLKRDRATITAYQIS
jgi:hypothetical protein